MDPKRPQNQADNDNDENKLRIVETDRKSLRMWVTNELPGLQDEALAERYLKKAKKAEAQLANEKKLQEPQPPTRKQKKEQAPKRTQIPAAKASQKEVIDDDLIAHQNLKSRVHQLRDKMSSLHEGTHHSLPEWQKQLKGLEREYVNISAFHTNSTHQDLPSIRDEIEQALSEIATRLKTKEEKLNARTAKLAEHARKTDEAEEQNQLSQGAAAAASVRQVVTDEQKRALLKNTGNDILARRAKSSKKPSTPAAATPTVLTLPTENSSPSIQPASHYDNSANRKNVAERNARVDIFNQIRKYIYAAFEDSGLIKYLEDEGYEKDAVKNALLPEEAPTHPQSLDVKHFSTLLAIVTQAGYLNENSTQTLADSKKTLVEFLKLILVPSKDKNSVISEIEKEIKSAPPAQPSNSKTIYVQSKSVKDSSNNNTYENYNIYENFADQISRLNAGALAAKKKKEATAGGSAAGAAATATLASPSSPVPVVESKTDSRDAQEEKYDDESQSNAPGDLDLPRFDATAAAPTDKPLASAAVAAAAAPADASPAPAPAIATTASAAAAAAVAAEAIMTQQEQIIKEVIKKVENGIKLDEEKEKHKAYFTTHFKSYLSTLIQSVVNDKKANGNDVNANDIDANNIINFLQVQSATPLTSILVMLGFSASDSNHINFGNAIHELNPLFTALVTAPTPRETDEKEKKDTSKNGVTDNTAATMPAAGATSPMSALAAAAAEDVAAKEVTTPSTSPTIAPSITAAAGGISVQTIENEAYNAVIQARNCLNSGHFQNAARFYTGASKLFAKKAELLDKLTPPPGSLANQKAVAESAIVNSIAQSVATYTSHIHAAIELISNPAYTIIDPVNGRHLIPSSSYATELAFLTARSLELNVENNLNLVRDVKTQAEKDARGRNIQQAIASTHPSSIKTYIDQAKQFCSQAANVPNLSSLPQYQQYLQNRSLFCDEISKIAQAEHLFYCGTNASHEIDVLPIQTAGTAITIPLAAQQLQEVQAAQAKIEATIKQFDDSQKILTSLKPKYFPTMVVDATQSIPPDNELLVAQAHLNMIPAEINKLKTNLHNLDAKKSQLQVVVDKKSDIDKFLNNIHKYLNLRIRETNIPDYINHLKTLLSDLQAPCTLKQYDEKVQKLLRLKPSLNDLLKTLDDQASIFKISLDQCAQLDPARLKPYQDLGKVAKDLQETIYLGHFVDVSLYKDTEQECRDEINNILGTTVTPGFLFGQFTTTDPLTKYNEKEKYQLHVAVIGTNPDDLEDQTARNQYSAAWINKYQDYKVTTSLVQIPANLNPTQILCNCLQYNGLTNLLTFPHDKTMTVDKFFHQMQKYCENANTPITKNIIEKFLNDQANFKLPKSSRWQSDKSWLAEQLYKAYSNDMMEDNLPHSNLFELVIKQVNSQIATQRLHGMQPNITLTSDIVFDAKYAEAIKYYCLAKGYPCENKTGYSYVDELTLSKNLRKKINDFEIDVLPDRTNAVDVTKLTSSATTATPTAATPASGPSITPTGSSRHP